MTDKIAATPGPWFLHDFTGATDAPLPMDVTVSCDHPATITVALMGRALTATLEEARANARLIAAAPDLLAALKSLMGHDDAIQVAIGGNPTHVEQVMARARAALAKAQAR